MKELDMNESVSRDKKKKSEAVPTLISDLEAAQEIAERLIPKHHDHLATANILFSCTNKTSKSGDSVVPGKVKKATPLDKWLARDRFPDGELDFIITIPLDVWNPYPPAGRTALVDHLLSHITGGEDNENGKMKWKLRPPQVREFPEVVERNGRWNEQVNEIANCLKGK